MIKLENCIIIIILEYYIYSIFHLLPPFDYSYEVSSRSGATDQYF